MSTPERPTVLVVDDDPYLHVIASLELPDLDLLEASTMEDAYELARRREPQAILVDRRLPDGDGLDLVRRIRRTQKLAQVPILFITAGHDEADRLDVLRAGADEYLRKPLEADEVLARLRRLLELPPDQLRPRRARLAGGLQRGDVQGDPDPVRPPGGGEAKGTARRRGVFRRLRRGR